MSGNKDNAGGGGKKSAGDKRQERLAETLRANLKRRKGQAREHEGEPDGGRGGAAAARKRRGALIKPQ